MHKWKNWVDSNCHSCDGPDDDTQHILLCPDQDCQFAWDDAIMGLEAWSDIAGQHQPQHPIWHYAYHLPPPPQPTTKHSDIRVNVNCTLSYDGLL